jgi:hypothetical protein
MSVKVVKNTEKQLKEALANNKIVYVERINDDIDFLEEFDSKDELILWYKKRQEEGEYDFNIFRTGEEAYILNCNMAFQEYIENYSDELLSDNETLEGLNETRDKANRMLTYNQVIKDIDRSAFVDGFYEWIDLKTPLIYGENLKVQYLTKYNDENLEPTETNFDLFRDVVAAFEIYFN